jgi:hypothetical protein
MAQGAEYQQRRGKAVVRLEAKKDSKSRALVALSGTVLTVRSDSQTPVQVSNDISFPKSANWKIRPITSPQPRKTRTSWERWFYVEPLGKPGTVVSLPLPVLQYREGNQKVQKVSWKPIPVHITSQIGKPNLDEMRPITGPEQVPPTWSWREVLVWTELSLLLAILVLIVAEVIGRRFRRTAVLSPAAWALRELDRLGGLDWSARGALEQFPTLLSDVLRRYLELRFRLRAPRQTTAEFLAAMQESTQLTPDQQRLLRAFLERCDLAKFARDALSEAECQALAGQVRGFVEQTAVAPE